MYQFGVGSLFAELADGTTVEFGTLQNANFDFSFDKKELYGRGQFPVKVARGKGKVDGKAQYADIKAEAINLFLNGTTSNGMKIIAEPFNVTVPEAKEVFLDIPNGGAFNKVLKVYDVSGTSKVPMTEVQTAPTVKGTYQVDAGNAPIAGSMTYTVTTNAAASDTITIEGQKYTFTSTSPGAKEIAVGATIKDTIANIVSVCAKDATINDSFTASSTDTTFTLTENSAGNGKTPSKITTTGTLAITSGTATQSKAGAGIAIKFSDEDKGKAVQYQFDYTASSGKTIEIKNAMMGTAPVFRVEFYAALDGIPLVVELNRVTSEKLTFDFKNEDFAIPDFTFSAFADASDVIGHIYLDE